MENMAKIIGVINFSFNTKVEGRISGIWGNRRTQQGSWLRRRSSRGKRTAIVPSKGLNASRQWGQTETNWAKQYHVDLFVDENHRPLDKSSEIREGNSKQGTEVLRGKWQYASSMEARGRVPWDQRNTSLKVSKMIQIRRPKRVKWRVYFCREWRTFWNTRGRRAISRNAAIKSANQNRPYEDSTASQYFSDI